MLRIILASLASLIVPAALLAQAVAPGPSDAFQIRYAANLTLGDSIIDLTNAGTLGQNAPICVNVYAFSPDEQEIACCSCLVSPNGLMSLSVTRDLIHHTLTGVRPSSIVIKLLAGIPSPGPSYSCDAAQPGLLAGGLRAWGTTIHTLPSGAPALTETEFSPATLSSSELERITGTCGFIQEDGSGRGICASCRTGAQ